MLLLKHLHIKNFRSIRDEEFDFPAFTVLVGRNDAGKSNILEAIQLLFEGTAASVRDEDFYDSEEPLEIVATLNGAREYLALCDQRNRAKVEERITNENEITIRRTTSEERKLSGIEIRNRETGEFQTPTGIDAALKPILPEIIFIGALADAAEQTKGTQKDALGKLICQVLNTVEEAVEPGLEAAYQVANRLLNVGLAEDGNERDNRIQALIDIEQEISGYIRETFPNSGIRLKVTLPSVKSIVGSITVNSKEGATEDPYYRRGNGFQRTLYLSLLRALATRIRAGREVARPFLLLFEEPEAFLHPDCQVKMLGTLQTLSQRAQVLIATHSPLMVSPNLLTHVVRIHKAAEAGRLKPITHRTGPLKDNELTALERQLLSLFSLQRSSRFLFSSGVVLVEGVGDEHLFPAIVERLRGFRIQSTDIAIIEASGKGTLMSFAQILGRLGLDTWTLTDLDFLWEGAGPLFAGDAQFGRFIERLRELAPPPAENTEAAKKEHKQRQIHVCTHELRDQRDRACDLLAQRRIFVLREGEIESYVGLGTNAKNQYLTAAQEIIAGIRGLNHREELERIAEALQQWSERLR